MAEQDSRISDLWEGFLRVEQDACGAKLALLRSVCPQAVGRAAEKDELKRRLEESGATRQDWVSYRRIGNEFSDGSFERWAFVLADEIYRLLDEIEGRQAEDASRLAGETHLAWSGR